MEVNKIINGDCLEEMRKLPENSVDSIVTDPPYELTNKKHNTKANSNGGFMGKKWDGTGISFSVELWKEALRVLKPGAHLLSFGGTRTYHRMTCAIEDAGFEIRDCIQWLYGSGFPKSLNVSKQIDKLNGKRQEEFKQLGEYIKERRLELKIPQSQIAKNFPSKTGNLTGCVSNWEKGSNVPTKKQWIILKKDLQLNNNFNYIIEREEAEREIIGKKLTNLTIMQRIGQENVSGEINITTPTTSEAKKYEGWGTALKPANEPIVVARKPLSEKNVALNVLKWGTGGINIDGCRVGTAGGGTNCNNRDKEGNCLGHNNGGKSTENPTKHPKINLNNFGRYPANIILNEEAGSMLDKQSGSTGAFAPVKKAKRENNVYGDYDYFGDNGKTFRNDKGGASRFFYCPKASKSERNLGCENLKKIFSPTMNDGIGGKEHNKETATKKSNFHPTVKPLKLMQYLTRLVTPKKGIVLDPFAGSGSTCIGAVKEGFNFIGIELSEDYCKIAEARLKKHLEQEKLKLL